MTACPYHRQTMTVPAEASVNMKATLVGKASDNVLYGASQDVPIVGETSGKGRTIIERESGRDG